MPDWKLIDRPFTKEFHDAIQQQHHATQYLAMLAKTFMDPKPDDSHTSLAYHAGHRALVGQRLQSTIPFRAGLRLADLTLIFVSDDDKIMDVLRLDGRSKSEAFALLQSRITAHGLDGKLLKQDLHYEIPVLNLDNSGPFQLNAKGGFAENEKYRYNAHLVLTRVALQNKNASEIRIWPHHFDTGGLIPIAYDEKNNMTRSIGIGFAIPDSMVEEPYFYISHWLADPEKNLHNLEPFSGKGVWKMPDWQGAVLPLSSLLDLTTAESQEKEVQTFFEEGIIEIKSQP